MPKQKREDFFAPIEVEHIKCTVEDIVNSRWLFNNIPWLNHSNKTAHLTLDKVSTVFYYKDGDVKSIKFNYAGVSALHGYAGNSYVFSFLLDDKEVYSYSAQPDYMSLAKDEVIQKALDSIKFELRRNNIQKNKLLSQMKDLNNL